MATGDDQEFARIVIQTDELLSRADLEQLKGRDASHIYDGILELAKGLMPEQQKFYSEYLGDEIKRRIEGLARARAKLDAIHAAKRRDSGFWRRMWEVFLWLLEVN